MHVAWECRGRWEHRECAQDRQVWSSGGGDGPPSGGNGVSWYGNGWSSGGGGGGSASRGYTGTTIEIDVTAIDKLAGRVDQLEAENKSRIMVHQLQLQKISDLVNENQLLLHSLADRYQRCGVPMQGDDSPRPSCRRERPRSGSLPPNLSCDHHAVGNGKAAAIIETHGMTVVTTASDAGPWWSHISSVLLFDKQPFSDSLWAWFELQFARQKIALHYYYSKRVRHFLIKCNCCTESFIMLYDTPISQEIKEERLLALAKFTNCTDDVGAIGFCPRVRADALLALCL